MNLTETRTKPGLASLPQCTGNL